MKPLSAVVNTTEKSAHFIPITVLMFQNLGQGLMSQVLQALAPGVVVQGLGQRNAVCGGHCGRRAFKWHAGFSRHSRQLKEEKVGMIFLPAIMLWEHVRWEFLGFPFKLVSWLSKDHWISQKYFPKLQIPTSDYFPEENLRVMLISVFLSHSPDLCLELTAIERH